MKAVKTITIVLLTIFLCTMLAACSNEEIAFFNLSKASTNLCLKPIEQHGEITFKISNLHNLLADSDLDPVQRATLEELLGVLSFKYDLKADLANDAIEYNVFFRNGVNSNYSELAKITIINNTMYIKLDKLCQFLRSTNNPSLIAFLDRGIQDTEYLMITPESYLELLGLKTSGTEYTALNSMFAPSEQIKTTQLMLRFMDGLVNEVYTNYSTGLITKDGNKYTISLDASQIVPTVRNILNYTIDNFDKFASYISKFINSLTEDELALLSLNAEIQTEITDSLESMAPMVELKKEEYKTKLSETLDQANTEIINVLAGSSLISSIEEINGTEYKSDINLELNVTTPESALGFSTAGTDSLKACQTFSASAPSGIMLTLQELDARINRVLKIKVDGGSWELNEDKLHLQGNSTVKFIDGYTYLPLRQIAEILGEEVCWDIENSQAYVVKNGQRIYMTGVIIDGRVYVKTRDFDYLNYKVDWDTLSRTVIITKSVI